MQPNQPSESPTRARPSGGTGGLPKLHLGCGRRFIPGFIHVDLDDFPHIDYRHDVRSLPMFPDNTVKLIYACHVLEYFDRVEVTDVLREWRRVLAPGGTLRVAVPDFAALVRVYQTHGQLDRLVGPLYGRIAVGPCFSMIFVQRAWISPSAASHEMRSKRPSPFASVRRSG